MSITIYTAVTHTATRYKTTLPPQLCGRYTARMASVIHLKQPKAKVSERAHLRGRTDCPLQPEIRLWVATSSDPTVRRLLSPSTSLGMLATRRRSRRIHPTATCDPSRRLPVVSRRDQSSSPALLVGSPACVVLGRTPGEDMTTLRMHMKRCGYRRGIRCSLAIRCADRNPLSFDRLQAHTYLLHSQAYPESR